MRRLILSLLVVIFCAPLPLKAQQAFAGTWKIDHSKTPPPLLGSITFAQTLKGGEHYSTSRGREYDFTIDGNDYPTDRPASTVAWTDTGASSWECTEKIRDRVSRKIHYSLSTDAQNLNATYTWFNPGNRTAQGSAVFLRVGSGTGLDGTWKMIQRVEEPDTFTIAFPVAGQMYFYIDPIDLTWVGPLDGTFMLVQSPMIPAGLTTAYTIIGPRKMTFESKQDAKQSTTGILEVSEDGTLLTHTQWPIGKDDQKVVLVLTRQPQRPAVFCKRTCTKPFIEHGAFTLEANLFGHHHHLCKSAGQRS